MRLGSLFAGVGGFDIAAERAGMQVAWQSEVDRHASKVLEHHWPGKNLGDIHGIVSPEPVNVLAGGFPCQSYSIAGNRGGLAEDRGALWWEYHRLIDGLGPEWVVAENVPGLLSSNGGRDFTTIVKSLVQLGYGVVWRVLDAQYFGVPQRRRRVFIVGHSGGRPRPEILALGESLSRNPEPSRAQGRKVTAASGEDATGSSLDPVAFHATQTPISGDISPTLSGTAHIGVGYHIQAELIGRGENAGPNGLGVREIDGHPGYTLNVVGGPQGIAVMRNREGKPGGGKGPMWSDKSFTLATGNDQTLFGSQVRKLTPLETERLQGFPDGHTAIDGNSDTQRYRQMGNAVAVPVAEWVLRRVVEHGE